MTCGGICMKDFAEISSKPALANTETRSALEDIYALRLDHRDAKLTKPSDCEWVGHWECPHRACLHRVDDEYLDQAIDERQGKGGREVQQGIFTNAAEKRTLETAENPL
jgi:hypothetical protein